MQDIATKINFVDFTPKSVQEWIVWHKDVNARNNFGNSEVKVKESSGLWESTLFTFTKHSFTLLKLSP